MHNDVIHPYAYFTMNALRSEKCVDALIFKLHQNNQMKTKLLEPDRFSSYMIGYNIGNHHHDMSKDSELKFELQSSFPTELSNQCTRILTSSVYVSAVLMHILSGF